MPSQQSQKLTSALPYGWMKTTLTTSQVLTRKQTWAQRTTCCSLDARSPGRERLCSAAGRWAEDWRVPSRLHLAAQDSRSCTPGQEMLQSLICQEMWALKSAVPTQILSSWSSKSTTPV